jgi:ParB-like chromosome segregation protein Spo0J
MGQSGSFRRWRALCPDRPPIERRAVAALVPYARNARRYRSSQVAEIAASIKEWGWTVPILVDEKDVIIAGHGRVMAAERLGISGKIAAAVAGSSGDAGRCRQARG